MIPKHRPPFGIRTVLGAVLSGVKTVSVEVIENGYAEAYGLYAILLPSARAGICWALEAAIEAESSVIGPAYTCHVVHEAMVRSGGRMCLIDTEASSFLMDPKLLEMECAEDSAIVLSEMYGYSYESYRTPVALRMRIIDAAMTVPTPELFARAKDRDCITLSFGIGKCLYSGFGGMILTRDADLACAILARRDSCLRRETLLLEIQRGAELLLRTATHERFLYGFLLSRKRDVVSMVRKWKRWRSDTARSWKPSPSDLETYPADWSSDENRSKEWHAPSTFLDRRLAVYNLEHIAEFYERRIDLAYRYEHNLAGVAGITLPHSSRYAMSHYTVRIPAQFRAAAQAALRRFGIETGTLYRFPSYLPRDRYPNAAKASSEVLNLPLDPSLTDADVDYICDCCIRCISHIWSTGGETNHYERRLASTGHLEA
jgi:dTDP-4-amino-4,6-dideoxygalactose transaminase